MKNALAKVLGSEQGEAFKQALVHREAEDEPRRPLKLEPRKVRKVNLKVSVDEATALFEALSLDKLRTLEIKLALMEIDMYNNQYREFEIEFDKLCRDVKRRVKKILTRLEPFTDEQSVKFKNACIAIQAQATLK